MEKVMKFNSIIKDVQLKKTNPLFSDAKVYVLYTGINRNNSHFSKESVMNSIETIFNIPVIGEYLTEKDNFGGHGGKLEITDNEVKYIQTTVPYGVVPSDVKIYWENVEEKDGTVNEYLVLDGVKLWSSRYEHLNVLLEKGLLGQSMEVEVQDGNFAIVDGKEVFKIEKFLFSALCMLGIDKGQNPDDHVEPCFESSKIVTSYSFDKENFKREFNQMLDELKFSLDTKGGNKVEETKQEFETNETDIQLESDEETKVTDAVDVTDVTEETPTEQSKTTEDAEETKESPTETEVAESFALTHNQIREQLRHGLNPNTNDHCEFSYWVVDYTDAFVIAEDYDDGCQLYKFDYKIENDEVKVNLESKQKVKVEYVPYEGDSFSYADNFERLQEQYSTKSEEATQEVNEFEVKFNELSTQFETLQTELAELHEFKRTSLETELSAKFEGQLTSEELAQVFEQSKSVSIADIEKELFALVGKKNFSIQNEKPVTKIAVDVHKDVQSKTKEPYGGLFAKHLNN